MKILELFAGSRSIGKEAEKQGYKVFSVDWTNYDNIDLVIDIEKLKLSDIPFVPDMVWASPDCTTYSIAAISHHRNGLLPKTNYAKKCDLVNIHMHSLIKEWLKINPNLKYYIENPTTIFSNNIRGLFNPDGWQPREQCFNGNTKCHHESAPRGSRTGTQGKKGSYERSKIPKELCEEVISATVNSC